MSNKLRLLMLFLCVALLAVVGPRVRSLTASDHDDGEVDTKGRNVNLTDLFVFREKDQNPSASENDLIFIMNLNPRSVARQQYYFSTKAKYEFKVTRAANNDDMPTGKPDVTLLFEFGAPNASNAQRITVTGTRDGVRLASSEVLLTTPINSDPLIYKTSLGGSSLSVFAGTREDPFFFDVEQFFRVRAGALGLGPKVGFRNPGFDSFAGYNVLSIVVRVPRAFLQGSSSATSFDVWETITVPGIGQVDRLARPAINEGLMVNNDSLNTMNAIGPDFEAAVLAGKKPEADIAKPIVAEAVRTLKALGNDDARAGALLGAFLPDVMRIDTTGPSGYANALNKKGSPIRGRLIMDPVIDITLSVLTNGAIAKHGVTYAGPNAGGTGHKPLLPGFPYLAEPN